MNNLKKRKNLDVLYESKVIAIVRAEKSGKFEQAVEAMLAGGIRILEVSMTTPGAMEIIRNLAGRFEGKVILGAGTVLDSETARLAIDAGAEFIFAPTLDRGTIEMCRRYSKIIIPGALTPTEILTAWQWGADLVKVFPAYEMSPSYIKSVKAPLPQVDMIAVGGVNLENAADFIGAGCSAVGIGSSLVKKELIEEERFGELTKLSRELVTRLEG